VCFNHGDERNWEVDSWLPFCNGCLAQGIPVIDMSTGGNSTFKTAIKMQGDDGAYIEIISETLIEPPDLSRLERKEQVKRLKQWQDFVAKAIVVIGSSLTTNNYATS